MRRVAILAVALVVAGAACHGRSDPVPPGPTTASLASPSPGEERAGEEGSEAEEGDEDRVDRAGVAPRTGPIGRTRTAGWRATTIFGNGNDWEPATAADPSAPYVYVVTTRYSGPGPLPCRRCDLPAIALKTSRNHGRTFGHVRFLPVNVRGGQYDPQIVTDASGDVYAAWIDWPGDIVVSRSTDHGSTWSDPVIASSPAPSGDHPWLGVSPNGAHVYIGFNHTDSWIAQSHDGGLTWLPAQQVSHAPRLFYANGTVVTNDGDVAVSTASYGFGSAQPPIQIAVVHSTDGGATFHTTLVDVVKQPRDCDNPGCPANHYGGHAVLARSGPSLVLAYDGATRSEGDQYIWTRRSTDRGVTWSARRLMSNRHTGMVAMNTAASGAPGEEIRIAWQASPRGQTRWNTIVRASHDGGRTWGPPVDVSNARSGYGYLHPAGYDADYGDYMGVTITDRGTTFAVWGAGFGYSGPGGTWFNSQR